MSKIVCEFTDPLGQMYVTVLQKKINEVCRKINFDDKFIEWHIYEPKINVIHGKNPVLEGVLIGRNGKDYGYTDIPNKIIYISTISIKSDVRACNKINSVFSNMIKCDIQKRELLADVILDEITHIQTGCNHGNKKYDTLLKTNENKYYGKFNELDI